ncbi:MAG: D-aminoacyl-tRNA deacylase [Planctomycetaceae bacterium]
MRIVLQRVARASVAVDGEVVDAIGPGYALLVGVGHDDTDAEAERLADKVVGLRIFRDEAGKTNLDLAAVGGEALVISQFTLYADTRKGRRPSFVGAADPSEAARLVERFAAALEARGVRVGRGVFGAEMAVDLVNEGPFTLVLDTAG